MNWRVIEVPSAGHRFLTSDRPVYMSALSQPAAHITLPIGPYRLFVAYTNEFDINKIDRLRTNDLVKSVNLSTVSNANKLVFGRDHSVLTFVGRHFCLTPQISMFRRAHQNTERIV